MKDTTAILPQKDYTIERYHHPAKVLLVDDKKENLFSLEKLLEDGGYKAEFIKCTSGNEALNIALKDELALILLDVQMPEMDGYEVAKFLKLNKRTSNIPIIFVTALDHEVNYILEGYKTGAVDYLFKPLNPAITRAKVNAFIQFHYQQKELEQKNSALQNLAMLVSNSIDLMCILDAGSLTINSLNPSWSKTLGIEEKSLLGQSIDALPCTKGCFKSLKNTNEKVKIFENEMIAESGEKLWFSWSFVNKNNLWYGNGKNITKNKIIEKQLESANEILEKKVNERTSDLLNVNQQLKKEVDKRTKAEEDLKQYNDRLVKANEELDSFVYVASHDLKAPIHNIESLITYLKKRVDGKISSEENKIFELLGTAINKFKTTLSDLGKIISIQKNLEEEYTEINLPTIIEDVKEDIKKQIEETSAKITLNLQVEKVNYARKNLRSIIYNLLSNAVKYRSPERTPEIVIKTWEESESIVIAVKDNGLGLNENQKKKMFTMFKRFHSHVDGSGVGLYLLKKIIENSGGEINFESTEGVGSEFKVYIKKVSLEK